MKFTYMILIAALIMISACSNSTDEQVKEEAQSAEEKQTNESVRHEETNNSEGIDEDGPDAERNEEHDGNQVQTENISLPDGTLTINAEGEDVQHVQEALRQIGYDIAVNGVYQTGTAQAVYHFQKQHDDLDRDGIYGPSTRSMLEEVLVTGETIQTDGFSEVELPQQNDMDEDFPPRGKMVNDPDDILVLVNKENHLPAGYTPLDLVEPDVPFPFDEDLPQRYMRAEAASALESLFAASEQEGLHLFAQSGFRSYDRQQAIFASNVEQNGEEQANQFSARAGESEHQTGLAMDVTTQEIGFQLNTNFADTEEGQWLADNAADYGFIIRYPRGKEQITGYQYEPWHIRYVGKESAKVMMDENMTLEEYVEGNESESFSR